jgi:hypothetical protein
LYAFKEAVTGGLLSVPKEVFDQSEGHKAFAEIEKETIL